MPSDQDLLPKHLCHRCKAHLAAEQALKTIAGLNYSVVRLPVVYGPADKAGLMPRIVCAATYQFTKNKMEFLWTPDLKVHTVHVQDVAVALWTVLCAGEAGEVYNVVDEGDTDQGKINAILESIFRIETGFVGTVMSTMAKLKLEELLDEANDGHLFPWERLKEANKIYNTPLSPVLDKELLYDHNIALDGSKLAALGFKCSCPRITKDLVLDAIRYWMDMGLFPKVDLY